MNDNTEDAVVLVDKAVDPAVPYVYVSPPDDILRQIGIDLFKHLIFTSEHIHKDHVKDVTMVFMPVLAMAREHVVQMIAINPVLFEYIDKALPRSVNGYPCFTSMRVVSADDWNTKVMPVYRAMIEAEAKV
jgi:hypothetical protein